MQNRIRVLVIAATLVLSLLAGAGEAAAGSGRHAAPPQNAAPAIIHVLGVTWE